jgi:hypothetical protein
LKRGREVREHNAKARETGLDEIWKERETDYSEEVLTIERE